MWAGYSPHDTDTDVLAAFCEKYEVDAGTVELKRTGGAVLVRMKSKKGK